MERSRMSHDTCGVFHGYRDFVHVKYIHTAQYLLHTQRYSRRGIHAEVHMFIIIGSIVVLFVVVDLLLIVLINGKR